VGPETTASGSASWANLTEARDELAELEQVDCFDSRDFLGCPSRFEE
jgi:hypothetical protein